jgi:hypothetical protein
MLLIQELLAHVSIGLKAIFMPEIVFKQVFGTSVAIKSERHVP